MSRVFIPTPVFLSFMGQGKSRMKTRKQQGVLAQERWQTENRQQDEVSAERRRIQWGTLGPGPAATLTMVEFSCCRPC